MLRAAAVALIAVLLTGCFSSYKTIGAPVPLAGTCEDLLLVGISRARVLELFGAPTNIHTTRDGEAFRYLYVRQMADGVDVGLSMLWGLISLSVFRTESGRRDTDNLTIFFDREGLLEAFSFSAAFADEP